MQAYRILNGINSLMMRLEMVTILGHWHNRIKSTPYNRKHSFLDLLIYFVRSRYVTKRINHLFFCTTFGLRAKVLRTDVSLYLDCGSSCTIVALRCRDTAGHNVSQSFENIVERSD